MSRNRTIFAFGLAFAVVVPFAAGHAAAEPRTYTTRRAPTPPRVDGLLNDEVWDTVEWAGDFTQHDPAEGEPPTYPTQFKILYDDANVYVAYRAFDPDPERIGRVLGRRDNFPGDWVEINIDSYHDRRTAFSFTASVSGTQGDEFISQDGANWDGNWDPVWEHEAHIDAEGWTAEARIPLSQLRYADLEEHVWGIQVMRRIYRHEERSVWQPISKDSDGWVSRFGELRGISGIGPGRRLEILPYTVAKAERFARIDGDPFADGSAGQLSGGLDGKFGVTSNLTLDLTVNPDFGQIEADPSVVNLTAFETFFEERRPFFIEGANIFEFRVAPSVAFGTHTTDRVLYSRRIGRSPQYRADFFENGFVDQPDNTSIVGAAKLTGRTPGGLSLGVLQSVTAEERAAVDVDGSRRDVTVEPLSNYFIGRVQQDFRQGDTRLGGMLTAANRKIDQTEVEFLHESAYVGAMDFFHYLGEREYYVALNLLGSRVAGSPDAMLRTQTAPARYFQRPDNDDSVDSTRTSLAGHAGSVRVGRSEGKLRFDAGAAWRSPGFEMNDLGFLRTADEVNEFSWVGYSLRNPFSIFRRMSFNANQWLDFEYAGENVYQAFNFNTNAAFRNNWSYNASITRENERISATELRGGPSMRMPGNVSTNAELNSDGRQKVAGGFGGSMQRYDDDTGKYRSGWVWLAWRPSDAIRTEISPSYSRNQPDLQFVRRTSHEDEDRFVYGALEQRTFDLSLRLDYAVTPTLSVQYYGAPFVSAGTYGDFRRVVSPRARSLENRFASLDGAIRYEADDGAYVVDEDLDGTDDYSFGNPDFNVRDFHSNLVVRWQYSAGSSFYLVWSQARSGFSPDGRFDLADDVDALFGVHPHDIFLVKFNRWFSL